MHLIHHFLEQSAKQFPDKVALIHNEVRATYSEINSKSNSIARFFLELGLKAGDRVALVLNNCLEYVVGYYGILKAGGVAVPINTDIKTEELNHFLEKIEPKVIISSSRFESLLKNIDLDAGGIRALILKDPRQNWGNVTTRVFKWEAVVQDKNSKNLDIFLDESALANIIFTSCSTGLPKGVMLSHRNIVSNTLAICDYLQLSEDDTQMVVLPFYYVMGQSLLNTHFAAGGTLVLNNKFAFTAALLKQMVAEEVTGFSGVPSTYAYLLHRSPLAGYREKLQSLRYCSQAGGHMARAMIEKLRKVLPDHTQIFIMYGATEAAARLTYLEPDRFEDKIDSIGKPVSGVCIRVVDKQGSEVPVGQTGELMAYGPNIMQGYWKDEAATKTALNNNGYRTGDIGYQDEEGYFYVVDRKDNILKVGGHKVNPLQIEDIILESNMVMEAAVVGLPDDLLGNRLVAVVAPTNKDCSEIQLLRHCAIKLPKHKVPSEIRFVKSVPKNSVGKVDRKGCIELISARP